MKKLGSLLECGGGLREAKVNSEHVWKPIRDKLTGFTDPEEITNMPPPAFPKLRIPCGKILNQRFKRTRRKNPQGTNYLMNHLIVCHVSK